MMYEYLKTSIDKEGDKNVERFMNRRNYLVIIAFMVCMLCSCGMSEADEAAEQMVEQTVEQTETPSDKGEQTVEQVETPSDKGETAEEKTAEPKEPKNHEGFKL